MSKSRIVHLACFQRHSPLLAAVFVIVSTLGCGGGGGGTTPAAYPSSPPAESLLGTDANADGIRDNVEAEINTRYATSSVKRDLSMRSSAALTAAMAVSASDPVAARAALSSESTHITCLRTQLTPIEREELDLEVMVMTANTAERAHQLQAVRDAAGAFVMAIPASAPC